MNEQNNFALVPKPPSALEKIQPGAKRILSGMIADTLALTKKEQATKSRLLRIVHVNDEVGVLASFDIVIRHWFPRATVLAFSSAIEALEELSQTEPDLLITDDIMLGMRGSELCQHLLDRKVSYPIIVDSTWETTRQWVSELAGQGLNIFFLPSPFEVESLRIVFEAAGLKTARELSEKPVAITPQVRRTGSPRIVILDDEEGQRIGLSMILKNLYDNIEIVTSESVGEAWRELKRLDPDLFITDMRHPGGQIFDCLSERNITYPILIVSAGVGLNADGDWVYGEKRVCSLGRNLKISCLSKPYCVEDFRAAVETALQVPARRTP